LARAESSEVEEWVVYGIFVASRLRYIGCTSDALGRLAQHKTVKFSGRRFEMECLARAYSEQRAREIEAELIRERDPPENVVHRVSQPKQRRKA
jgi:predicted GIY-YIG superfamily endonuclease